MADWRIEYGPDKSEFRLNDLDGCVSDIYGVQADGIALVKLEAEEDDEEDVMLLVATYNYTGEDFEPDTVYDLDAVETDVAHDVDLNAMIEEDEGEEEGEE